MISACTPTAPLRHPLDGSLAVLTRRMATRGTVRLYLTELNGNRLSETAANDRQVRSEPGKSTKS